MFAENSDDMVSQTAPVSRGANVNGWQYQMKNPIFKDERIRRALSLAFDRKDFDLANNGGDNQNPKGRSHSRRCRGRLCTTSTRRPR